MRVALLMMSALGALSFQAPAASRAVSMALRGGALFPTEDRSLRAVKRGVWHMSTVRADHCGIVPFPPSHAVQVDFFDRLFAYLRAADAAAELAAKLAVAAAAAVAMASCPERDYGRGGTAAAA